MLVCEIHRSRILFGCRIEIIPSKIPIMISMMRAATVSMNVFGRNEPINSLTGRRCVIDIPRFPEKQFFIHSTYCVNSGLSKPKDFCNSMPTDCGIVGDSAEEIGLPGAKCAIINTNVTKHPRMMSPPRIRLTTNLTMSVVSVLII